MIGRCVLRVLNWHRYAWALRQLKNDAEEREKKKKKKIERGGGGEYSLAMPVIIAKWSKQHNSMNLFPSICLSLKAIVLNIQHKNL